MSILKKSYLGNPKLKKVGIKIDFTKEQIEEIIHCTRDPFYFIENYVKIVSLDKGLIPCKLYDHQRRMIQNFIDNRMSISLCSRQIGKTIGYVTYILWYALFNEHKNIVLLANRVKTARDILARVKLAYEHLPIWLQQGVAEWAKTSIELENGSKVSVDATTGNAARSGAIDILILDEFAFVPNNIAQEFFKSVYPTITSGTKTKIIIVSTANGVNLFYKLFHDAERGLNSYSPFKAHWSEVPGRDQKWKEATIKDIGQEAFRIEFENEFFGSVSNTLISSSKLNTLPYDQPLYSENNLDIYEFPVKNKEYIICVDTARGDQNNSSAFSVIKISDMPYRVVAKYASNSISAMMFPDVIVGVARKYNDAFLLVEINDIGGQVIDMIKYDLEYENVLSTQLDKRLSAPQIAMGCPKGYKLGIRTTTSVKRIGCFNLKTLIEEDKLIVPDFDTISELTTFVSKEHSYAAESGSDDDLVMTLVLFGWLTGQKYFKEITGQNLKQSLMDSTALKESEILYGVKDDHQDELTEDPFEEDGDLWFSPGSEVLERESELFKTYNELLIAHMDFMRKHLEK